ncbi:alpha/beta hydrolase [Flagellimonas flava]|uniref:alpha/beta hydrolase n=1 Tax=Flagellimonas flava TaxID=570519 RepID=UPI003D65673A
MKNLFNIIISVLLTFGPCYAQDSIINIWPKEIPNQNESNEFEIQKANDIFWIENVQEPTLEVFLPSAGNSTGKAVIICPGGAYLGLAYDLEGTDVAKRLNADGIAAFVLKYRLPTSKCLIKPHEAPLMDAKRAIRTVRHNAKRWKIRADKIGIMGFSAGGHLASTLATHYHSNQKPSDTIDRQSAKPDFVILVYPVISMDAQIGHAGSRENLLGKNPNHELIKYYSNELHVNSETSPTFLVHSSNDTVVTVKNSILYYQALQREQIYSEMHIYPHGGHGYGLALDSGYLKKWTNYLSEWIEGL